MYVWFWIGSDEFEWVIAVHSISRILIGTELSKPVVDSKKGYPLIEESNFYHFPDALDPVRGKIWTQLNVKVSFRRFASYFISVGQLRRAEPR